MFSNVYFRSEIVVKYIWQPFFRVLAISFYGIHCVEILKFCTTVTSLKLCNTHRSSEVLLKCFDFLTKY